MSNAEIILELETAESEQFSRAQRVEAVRAAKDKFLQSFHRSDYSGSIQVAGQNLSFPLLVLKGPRDQIDTLFKHAVEQFPGMIRKINRGGKIRLID